MTPTPSTGDTASIAFRNAVKIPARQHGVRI